MRSIWSGTLSLGLINIPVNLISAVSSSAIDFDLVHKDDLCPINYARVCRRTGQEIPYDKIARAYKLDKKHLVTMEDSDFEAANIRKYNSISIMSFVESDTVSKIFFEKPYYLKPQEGAERPYHLFATVLQKTKKAALGKYVLRNREHLALIEPQGNVLVLYQLRFAQEIKKPDFKVEDVELARKEIDLASSLIESLTDSFDITKHRDTYNDELMEIINRKAKGEQIEKPQPIKETHIPDLVKALEESLRSVEKHK